MLVVCIHHGTPSARPISGTARIVRIRSRVDGLACLDVAVDMTVMDDWKLMIEGSSQADDANGLFTLSTIMKTGMNEFRNTTC